jgi:hypothetical protein
LRVPGRPGLHGENLSPPAPHTSQNKTKRILTNVKSMNLKGLRPSEGSTPSALEWRVRQAHRRGGELEGRLRSKPHSGRPRQLC